MGKSSTTEGRKHWRERQKEREEKKSSTTEGRKHWRERQKEREEKEAQEEPYPKQKPRNKEKEQKQQKAKNEKPSNKKKEQKQKQQKAGNEESAASKSQSPSGTGSGASGWGSLETTEATKGEQWHHKHTINADLSCKFVFACHWVNARHLALCCMGCVKVYEVTTTGSHLAYTLTSSSPEWTGEFKVEETAGVAVSESLPDSILAINRYHKPYVFQFPCHEATEETMKYKIQSEDNYLYCIAANANVCVVNFYHHGSFSFIVCSLPDFTQQRCVQVGVVPYDFSITPEYLLLMSQEKMVLRSLQGDICQDVWEMAPHRKEFLSVCFRDAHSREMYCIIQDPKSSYWEFYNCSVYKYIWDGTGVPVNTGSIINGPVQSFCPKCFSVTPDGWMAIGCDRTYKVELYSLEP